MFLHRYVKNLNENKLLRDLGLGRETNFKYPWRPDQSPIPEMCKDPINGVNDMWDTGSNIPGTGCNEFIFTRA